jgi:hypothetical protein
VIDLRRFSPIRVHVHRRPADGCATVLPLPARLPARGLSARRPPAGAHARPPLGDTETFGPVTAYDDDWFIGRPATP